jgi:hypothetical protein
MFTNLNRKPICYVVESIKITVQKNPVLLKWPYQDIRWATTCIYNLCETIRLFIEHLVYNKFENVKCYSVTILVRSEPVFRLLYEIQLCRFMKN